ncbi:MAG: pyridoxine 5'-phosphate synthase [Myxococcales bacterium]|nr:pyridoxine 5'-phosphate synthase [Myxococcales bacterium]
MPAKLSVNINKYALLRNSRGHNVPDLRWAADVAIAAGAHGITVHPRMDQRHVRFDDVPELAAHLAEHHPDVELNIECENHPEVVARVLAVRPAQCTLVPVRPGEVTSDHGYVFPQDTPELVTTIAALHAAGIRTSLFVDCDPDNVVGAAATGTDRVEIYTGPYAWAWGTADQDAQVRSMRATIANAAAVGLGVNAGHDLDRFNLAGIADQDGLLEVSIGHAQICRALEVGTSQSVRELLTALGW